MCLRIDIVKRKVPKPQVAIKDINVYKVINKNGFGWCSDLYINGEREKWTPGTHYTETTPFKTAKTFFDTYQIHGHAFHSCKNITGAKNKKCADEMIVKMIIPKGALYYESDSEYASSDIIYPYEEKAK